jgi:hypothetical protein
MAVSEPLSDLLTQLNQNKPPKKNRPHIFRNKYLKVQPLVGIVKGYQETFFEEIHGNTYIVIFFF